MSPPNDSTRLERIEDILAEAAQTERDTKSDGGDRFDALEKRLLDGHERMDRIETQMSQNTEMTQAVYEMLIAWRAGMNAIAKVGRGFAWIGGKVYTLAKYLGPVASAGLAIYAALYAFSHGGSPPPGK